MALGNANSSAQSRGKNKPVIVKRRKEVVLAKSYTSIVATDLTGESNGSAACSSGLAFNKVYYVDNVTDGKPDVGAKMYKRSRASVRYLVTEGLYLIKVGEANWVVTINSSNVVASRVVCR